MTPRMSLIERKKLQWAKEREELASLGGTWGHMDPQNIERAIIDPKSSMVAHEYIKRNLRDNAARRGSLPPLYKNQYNSLDRYDKGGETTSGYGSDNNNQTDFVPGWNQSGYESSSSRDDRPRWADKGGKIWQNKEETPNEPPNWVKRGLKAGEIEVNNTSPSVSPEQRLEEQERPCTSSSYSHQRATYIRGQNIPIDSVELAERERRRQLALAHQEAIRQQLEDRERKRREEREKRIQEEHEEELRIEKEQETERKRKEEEQRTLREKQEKERRRNEAIQEAIELAQKEAQLEKAKRKNINITRDELVKDKTVSCSEIEKETKHHNNQPEQLNNTKNVPSTKQEVINTEINDLEIRGKGITTPRNQIETATTATATTQPAPEEPNQVPINLTPRTDNIAFVLPTTIEALPTIQYALLVPTTPFNIPQTSRSTASTARTENRILTPTQYRLKNVLLCDSSTQTDESVFGTSRSEHSSEGRVNREKLTNLELSYDNRIRKDRRSRSESLEERPKWGVNRPPTRYLKQSEKDPLYQRRKLRQKMRESKPFDDKNSSDDDSQTVSPRPHRKRTTRALWRNSEHMYSRNVRMYHSELVPLESDRDRIYYSNVGGCCCSCMCGRHRCSDSNAKVDILKIDHNSPRESEAKLQLPRVDGIDDDVLHKLSSLQNGLLAKQEQWDTSSLSANH